MNPQSAPSAGHRSLFESRDADFTLDFMASKDFSLKLDAGGKRDFDFCATVGYLPNSYVGTIGYGAAATVHAPPDRKRDDYFIHLPLHGKAEVTNQEGSVACAAGFGVISSPEGHLTRSGARSSRITVSLTKLAIRSHLTTLLGDAPETLPQFASAIDLTSTTGQRFERHVRMILADFEVPASTPGPIMLAQYEELLLTDLLLGQPNNYAEALERLQASAAPEHIRRAIDFMQAHLELPITLADIVAATGIPGRTLQKHFQDHRGVSPMRYLRTARLARVREALLKAGDAGNVTDLAMTWGFSHLGRFAGEYRRHFGESPSETWRRGRRNWRS